MADPGLPSAIEAARKRLKLSKVDYAKRVGLTEQGLRKILSGGGVGGATLSRLQASGGLRVTRKLIASLNSAA